MNENESRIRELLGEGIGQEPPIAGGSAAVFAGARRRVVRTRMAAGALSAVAVLGVATGVVVAGGGPGTSGGKVPPGVSAPPTPGAAGTTGTPGTRGTPPGQVLMDGRSVDELIKLTLPKRLTTGGYSGEGNTWASSAAFGELSVNDGLGQPTQVLATVGRHEGEAVSAQACQNRFHTLPGITDCRADPQPDGSVVLVYREDDNHRSADGRPLDTYQLVAERLFPDGTNVLVAASNWFAALTTSPTQTAYIAPTRSAPLVSQAELVTMVMDPRWGATVPADFARQAQRDITPFTDMTGHAIEG